MIERESRSQRRLTTATGEADRGLVRPQSSLQVAGARYPAAGHGRALAIDLARLQLPVRRNVPDAAKPLEPVGPEPSIAIMATGMVLIIVSRNIDLSVGSMLGFTGYIDGHGSGRSGSRSPRARLTTSGISGSSRSRSACAGRGDRGLHRASYRLRRGPVLHRHPRRPPGLARPHLPDRAGPDDRAAGRDVRAPRRRPEGLYRRLSSWILGLLACAGIVYALIARRRRKRRNTASQSRPGWATSSASRMRGRPRRGLGRSTPTSWPEALRTQYAQAHGITEPPGGLIIPTASRSRS